MSEEMSDAHAAFNSFFSNEETPETNKENDGFDNIKKEVTKKNTVVNRVDANDVKNVKSVSVDDAKKTINRNKDFKEVLKDLKIPMSDLFKIIDTYLETGYYEKSYKIKHLEFTFKTKSVRSIDQMNDALDGSKYTMASAAAQMLMEHSLAATLTYIKIGKQTPRVFNHDTPEADEAALEFVKELSVPIYALLSNKLRDFELRTGLATRDEAIEYFLAHTQG